MSMRGAGEVVRSTAVAVLALLNLLALSGGVVEATASGSQSMDIADAQAVIFTVNSTADPGDGVCDAAECTLREAINSANANPGLDTIGFNIPGPGPHTIQPTSALPTITNPVIIDGYTQSGASPNTKGPGLGSNAVLKIELDGSNAGANFVHGLHITAAGSTVWGMVINRFSGNGVAIFGSGASGNLVQGNFLGTDPTGSIDLGNLVDGVQIRSAANNTIGGITAEARNVISGNDVRGISIQGGVNTGGVDATGNLVLGNFIGTDITGTVAIGNSQDGVVLRGALGNTIGVTQPDAQNVISGNRGGVLIKNIPSIGITGASQNLVKGNFIGTDVTGTAALGNAWYGVLIERSSNNTLANNTVNGNGGAAFSLAISSGNTFFHNNIFDSVNDPNPAANDWHHPVLEEGNFWSDYTGADDGSGTGKHAIAGDGIGDTLIPHPGPGFDNFPFVNEIDPTKPTVSITSPADGSSLASTSVMVSGTASDAVGVERVELSTDGMTWVLATGTTSWSGTVTLAEGPNTIFARATDTSGNTATVTIAVTADTVKPTADAGEDQTASVGAAVSFDASASSDDVAIVSYEWDFGDGTTGTGQATAHIYVDPGTYTVTLAVRDAAGNTDTDLLTVTVVDMTMPTVSITSPADGSSLASTSVMVSGTASDAVGVERVELSTDGMTWVLATGTTSWSGTVTLAEGPNTIFARATDTSGNTATVTIAVTADTVKPTVAITSPTDGATLNSTSVVVSGTASDNGAVEMVELSLDGTNYVLATGTTSWSGTLTLAGGPNTIFARATDTAGNTATVSIAVTATSPVNAGDFIKYSFEITGAPSGAPVPTSMEIEFLSVRGFEATIRITLHISDGTEANDTTIVDLAAGGGSLRGLAGFVIPVGRTAGDPVFISGVGDVTIEGETTRTYAGASRTVVFASFMQGPTELTYYWDRQTGVMVELSFTSASVTGTAKVVETSMWGPDAISPSVVTFGVVGAIAAAAAGVALLLLWRRRAGGKRNE